MIQDFIDANELDARIVSFPSEVSVEKALALNELTISNYAKAVPFVNEKMDFFVVVKLASEKVDIEDAEDLFDENLNEIDSTETEKLTGFEKSFFPPVSVLGAKLVFTKLASKSKKFLFALGPKEYLIINVDSIRKAQELSDYFFEEK